MENLKNICILFFFIIILNCKAQTNNSESTAITNITLIDVENSKSLKDMTIVISDHKIKAVFSRNSQKIPMNADIIDMTGHYIIPGLIDSHVHLFRRKDRKKVLKSLFYSGITTVRDMGGDARIYQKLVKEIAMDSLKGPNIFYAANVFGPTFLDDPRTKFANRGIEPGQASWMRVITNETNLEKVVAEAKESGVTGLKVYSNIPPALLKRISQEAHGQGLKMWSHASIFPSKPSDAVKAEVDVLSHGVGMIFEIQSNMPKSYGDAIKNHVAMQDFKNANETAPEFISLFEQMKLNETIFEPTLSAFNAALRSQKQKTPNVEKVNPTAHMQKAAQKMDLNAMNNWAKRITKAAYEHGVTISAGTDLSRDVNWLQDEIKFLTECGLTNMDAIKAATLNNAKVIGIEDTHGSVSIGKQADFIILSENPLDKIENIRTVVSVYKNGKEYSTNK